MATPKKKSAKTAQVAKSKRPTRKAAVAGAGLSGFPSGLDPDAVDPIKTIDNKLADRRDTISGAALMNRGLTLRLSGDSDSTMLIFDRVDH